MKSFLLSDPLDQYGYENDKTFHQTLKVDADSPHIEDVGNDPKDQDPGKSSDDRSFTS